MEENIQDIIKEEAKKYLIENIKEKHKRVKEEIVPFLEEDRELQLTGIELIDFMKQDGLESMELETLLEIEEQYDFVIGVYETVMEAMKCI